MGRDSTHTHWLSRHLWRVAWRALCTMAVSYHAGIHNSHQQDGVTWYQIKVSVSTGSEWLVDHRFSEFEALRTALTRGGVNVDHFPRKHLVRSNSSSVVADREKDLSAFLKDFVLEHVDLQPVRDFLQLDKAVIEPAAAAPQPQLPNASAAFTQQEGSGAPARSVNPLPATIARPGEQPTANTDPVRDRAMSAAERIKHARNNNTTSDNRETLGVPSFLAPVRPQADRETLEPFLPIGFQRATAVEQFRVQEAEAGRVQADATIIGDDMPLGFRRATVYGAHDERF